VTERSAALGIGTLAAVIVAAPAVPRVVLAGADAALGFLALSGGAALVLGPALVFAGTARIGSGLRAALLGLAVAAAPLALLAEGLKQSTHHRPLGAATFAVLALATIACAIAVAWRLLRFSESASAPARRIVSVGAALVGTVSVGFVLVRALEAPALVPHVLDGLRGAATATLGHLLLRVPRVTRVARRLGAPMWVAVVILGLVTNRGVTGAATRTAAPVVGGPLAWF
jgi:hypothetical protein